MNRDRVQDIMKAFGNPAIVDKDGETVLVFARQDMKDVEEIEKMGMDELKQEWKEIDYCNNIAGSVSLNELQRLAFVELEINSRPDGQAIMEELLAWDEEETRKYEASEARKAKE
jgi:hypothetical protein